MCALFEKKKPFVPLFVFFLLLFAERFSVLTQPFSDASNVAVDGSRFAKKMEELPDGLRNDSSIGFTKEGNLTLTLLKTDIKAVSIPLVAFDSSSKFLFRASLNDGCNIETGQTWNLSYLGEEGKQVELSIIWNQLNFILMYGSNKGYIGAEPKEKDEVDVLFDKSLACVRKKNAMKTDDKGMLNGIVPVDMQAMANGAFNLSLSHVAGSDKKCSITLEFDGKKFGLLKPMVTTTMPALYKSTKAPEGTDPLVYIILGIFLLVVCLMVIGFGIYYFIKHRHDKRKDPEKNAAVDDSRPAIGVSSFSATMTAIGTSGKTITAADSKADPFSDMSSTERKLEAREGAEVVKATAVGKKSKKEEKVASKKVIEKEDKPKSSKPDKAAEEKPGPKGKKIYVPLIDMDNSLKSISKKKTPATVYENY